MMSASFDRSTDSFEKLLVDSSPSEILRTCCLIDCLMALCSAWERALDAADSEPDSKAVALTCSCRNMGWAKVSYFELMVSWTEDSQSEWEGREGCGGSPSPSAMADSLPMKSYSSLILLFFQRMAWWRRAILWMIWGWRRQQGQLWGWVEQLGLLWEKEYWLQVCWLLRGWPCWLLRGWPCMLAVIIEWYDNQGEGARVSRYLIASDKIVKYNKAMADSNPLIDKRTTYNSFCKSVAMCWNIALSSFYFGYIVVYLGTIPTDTLKHLYHTDLANGTVQGVFNGAIPIGALVGALVSRPLIAKLSRRNCLLAINAIAFAAGFAIYLRNFYSFLIFRFLQGFCVGFYSSIVSLIIKELAPNEISGTLGTLPQFNVTLGVFFGPLFKYILTKATGNQDCKDFWWIVFGFTQITLVIQTVLLLFVFPYETPKYLLSVGREADARALIEVIYKEEFVEEVMDEKRGDLISLTGGSSSGEDGSIMSDSSAMVRQVKDLKITIFLAIHLAVMQQFSGINAIVVYGSKIAVKATSGQLSLLIPSLINLDQVLTTFFTGYLLSKFGRKTLLTLGAFLEGLATGIITIGFFLPEDNSLSTPLIIVGLFLFMAVFGLSLGPVVWLYIPEIVQPRIVPYSTAANWIIASVVIILFPILTDGLPDQNPAPLFIFFTAWCIGSTILNWVLLIETKDKPERLIRQQYNKKGICD